jgi:hypothetical protein
MQFKKFAYTLCRNGHWFCGEACPIDGYRDPFVSTVVDAVGRLQDRKGLIELSAIALEAGLRAEVLAQRVMIVERPATEEELPCFLERTS